MSTRTCLQCGRILVSSFSKKFCSRRCALTWRNLHDKEFYEKRVRALKEKISKKVPQDVLYQKYVMEEKTIEEVAKELGISTSTVKRWIKLYRIPTRKKLLEKTKKLISEKKVEWTKEKIKEEFQKIVEKLGRTPAAYELTELGAEGLRHAIFRRYGSYTDFLTEEGFDLPAPVFKNSRKENFRLLASKCALKYRQNGNWSSSELKVKEILDEMGLIEKLDYWHNFEIRSPLQGIYQLDFYLPRWKLVIECDSFWHDIGESPERDQLRDEWVQQKLGCRTLRFRNFGEKALEEIKRILKQELSISNI